MKYIKFTIKKFKGIDELELDLSKIPTGKIFPLVGLNEAGKTTILEAIGFFQNGIEDEKAHELIHKRDKGHFTGKIEVSATLLLNSDDKELIGSFFRNKRYIHNGNFDTLEITKKIEYKNGKFVQNLDANISFPNTIEIKGPRERIFRTIEQKPDLLKELLDYIKEKLLPKILFFENFVFKFPEKIFLEDIPNPTHTGEDLERQKKYRNVIEDILQSCNTSYTRTDLISKLKSSDSGVVDSGKQILREMEIKLNEKILDHWNAIFPDSPRKTISIEYGQESNGLYLQVKISEGSSTFYVDERSLGFRWFFGFILFTEFRKVRVGENGEYLFLFDEPASNLHETSQSKILILFDKIVENAKIIYSTHSPYILKPDYLLSTFIVKDEGRESESEYSYRQNIKATPYKQFVANSSNEDTHYKPLLDVLEFQAHDFEFTDPIVFFEGKNDYYTFKWILENYFQSKNYNFKLYPGAGVNKYENIFREYLAHNKKFIAVFDADGTPTTKGKGAKNRYIKNISQELENQVFTLADIDSSFYNFTTESLFSDNEKLKIIQKSSPKETIYSKGKFNSAIQELFIKKEVVDLSENTLDNFKKIFDFIQDKLSHQN